MRILAIGFIFNERPYLPELIRYYKNQGCELYFIDNMSTDGTFEYLQKEGIPCHQFDTKECFYLNWLQAETDKVIHQIRPDWVVYIAGDLYHLLPLGLENYIEEVDRRGYTQISLNGFEFFNTGEKHETPLFQYYFRGKEYRRLILISKYDSSLKLNGDDIHIENRFVWDSDGLYLNYGGCKPKEIQEAKLQRTINAWQKGMNTGYSEHFPVNKKRNWIWSKEETMHYSDIDDLGLIEKFLKENT